MQKSREMSSGGVVAGTPQALRVKKEVLVASMTYPLYNKLLRYATTMSECLQTFCRKCIFEKKKKLIDEEEECCPICHIDLGCVPVEKLRPDHEKILRPESARSFTCGLQSWPDACRVIFFPILALNGAVTGRTATTPFILARPGPTWPDPRRSDSGRRKMRRASFDIPPAYDSLGLSPLAQLPLSIGERPAVAQWFSKSCE